MSKKQTKPDTLSKTFTVEQAGRVIGIGRSAAYKAAKQGTIPVIRLGNRLVVPKEALERWLGEIRPQSAA